MTESGAASLERIIGSWGDGADPLNEQLAAGISHAIHRGDLPPGARLPSERELATRLGVSRTTIVAAYDRLRATGMVRSRQGSGTRVVARPADAPIDSAYGGPGLFQPYLQRSDVGAPTGVEEDVISLTIGALPGWPGLAGIVEQTVREDLPELLTDFGYLPFGLPALRTAICRYLEGLGLPTREDEVLVTSGAQQAVHLVSSQLAGPDAAVAIEDPTYLGAVDALRAVGARMLSIPLDGDGIRLDVLARTLAAATPAFVYVVPTYQNPTGSLLPEAARRELVELAQHHRTLIVEDLTPTLGTGLGLPPPIGAFASPDRVVTIGSLSKGGWGGLRIGWVRADRTIVMRLAAAKAIDDHGSSILSQAVAIRVLADAAGHAERSERESLLRREAAAAAIREQLPDWRVTPSRGGLSLWVRLPSGDAESFSRVAAGQGVIVRPGPVASPQGAFRDHIRVAVGEDPDRLIEGIRRLALAWAIYKRERRPSFGSVAISV